MDAAAFTLVDLFELLGNRTASLLQWLSHSQSFQPSDNSKSKSLISIFSRYNTRINEPVPSESSPFTLEKFLQHGDLDRKKTSTGSLDEPRGAR